MVYTLDCSKAVCQANYTRFKILSGTRGSRLDMGTGMELQPMRVPENTLCSPRADKGSSGPLS